MFRRKPRNTTKTAINSHQLFVDNSLLKEIKCEATINDLIGVVCTEDNFLNGVKNIVCNYDANNILHQYAISNKEVSAILISHKQRRIKLTYTLKNGIWYEFVLRNRRYPSLLYICLLYTSDAADD